MLYPNAGFFVESRSDRIFLDVLEVDIGDFGIIAVENLRNLFKRRPSSLNVCEAYKDEFNEDPDLIELSTCTR